MTDTPRTQAELLAIFANNQNHDITAQDMRDFVKSARPAFGYEDAAFYSVTYNASTTLATIPAGGATGFAATTLVFPWGPNIVSGANQFHRGVDLLGTFSILDTDPAVTWATVDSGNAFDLRTGTWFWQVQASFIGDAFAFPASSTVNIPVGLALDQATYDPDFSGASDGTEAYLYDNWNNALFSQPCIPQINTYPLGQDPGEAVTLSWFGIVINDTPDPKPFVMIGYGLPGWTTDMHALAYGLNIWSMR